MLFETLNMVFCLVKKLGNFTFFGFISRFLTFLWLGIWRAWFSRLHRCWRSCRLQWFQIFCFWRAFFVTIHDDIIACLRRFSLRTHPTWWTRFFGCPWWTAWYIFWNWKLFSILWQLDGNKAWNPTESQTRCNFYANMCFKLI